MNKRVVGISQNPNQPVKVIIDYQGQITKMQLDSVEDKIDFLYGRLPCNYRPAMKKESVVLDLIFGSNATIPFTNLQLLEELNPKLRIDQIKKVGKDYIIPDCFDGIQGDDHVVIAKGKHYEQLSEAISRRLEKLAGNGRVTQL